MLHDCKALFPHFPPLSAVLQDEPQGPDGLHKNITSCLVNAKLNYSRSQDGLNISWWKNSTAALGGTFWVGKNVVTVSDNIDRDMWHGSRDT